MDQVKIKSCGRASSEKERQALKVKLDAQSHSICNKTAQEEQKITITLVREGGLLQRVTQQIEPESQTQLLDTTMNMEGVLLAGVPGAGGFDAIFAVTLGDSCSNVSKVWSSVNVLALLVREDPRGVSLESGDPRTKGITAAVSSIHIE